MTITTPTRPAAPPTAATPAPRPAYGLDARLAATGQLMDQRLVLAGLRLAIDSRHTESAPTLDDVARAPVQLPEPEPAPYPTPAAAALQRAARRLQTAGWCRGATRAADGALCLYGAVRAETGGGPVEDDGLAVLLDVIRRRWPGAETIPAANDHQVVDGVAAVRLLQDAALLADARGL